MSQRPYFQIRSASWVPDGHAFCRDTSHCIAGTLGPLLETVGSSRGTEMSSEQGEQQVLAGPRQAHLVPPGMEPQSGAPYPRPVGQEQKKPGQVWETGALP